MLHLPQKSIITPIPKERTSSISIAKKLSQFTSDPNPSTNVPTKCYKSYTDLCHRVVNLKLPVNWNVTSDESIVSVKKILSEFMIPELEVYITPALDFTVRVFAWNIPETHGIYENNCRSVDNITVSNLVTSLDKFHLCNGVSLFVSGIIPHVVQKTYNTTETFISPIQQKVFYRPANCDVLLTGEQVVCNKCIAFKQRHCRSSMESSTPTPAKLKAPISGTSNARLQARFKLEREEKKLLHDRVKELELALNESSTVEVKDYLHDDLVKIYSQNLNSETPNFMKLFWEEQQKYVGKSRKGIRYHPMIIRYCLNLAAKSSAAYEEIRYDEKLGTGFLVLPSQRRLRDYRNYIKPERGFNKNIISELKSKVSTFSDLEKHVILSFDEMKIENSLVWDKHTGNLIGYVDLGDEELNYATLKKQDELASHVMVFMIRGLINPFKFSFANFATANATAIQIYPLVWKALGILEKKCHLKVLAICCDGMSSNRSFFEMHQYLNPEIVEKGKKNKESVDKTYRSLNSFCPSRYLYFVADPPHLMKTARNCLYKSGKSSSSRYMWNDNLHLLWSHVSKFYYEDADMGLQYLPKITNDHIQLNSYSIMNVRLAVQILSNSVGTILKSYGPPEAAKTAEFCIMMDKFFDCTNVRNTTECIHKRKTFLKPYTSLDDERFSWLTNDFTHYLDSWKENILNREGNFDKNARAAMFLSYQTYQGLKITSSSLVEIVQYLLNAGAKYVLTERLCQDALENYFGRQRAIGGRKDNPNLRDFGYGDNIIRNSVAARSIKGNVSGNQLGISNINIIDSTPLPCRKRKSSNALSHTKRQLVKILAKNTEGQLAKTSEGELAKNPEGQLAKTPEGQLAKTSEGELAKTPEGQLAKTPEGQLA